MYQTREENPRKVFTKLKVLSLYCGAGGIDEGLKQSGIKTTLAIDINNDCCETMKLNHDCEIINGKVKDYEKSLKGFDIIVGGPPCQDFSRANKNRDFNSCEIDLFWDLIDNIKPKYYLMENVQDVIRVTNRDNYLVNVSDYGVAQDRIRRIFTNLPLPTTLKKIMMKDVLKQKEYGYLTDFAFPNRNQKCPSRSMESISMTLTTMKHFYLTPIPIYTRKYLPKDKHIWLNKTKDGLDNGMICREITNTERALLQGFDVNYKFFGNEHSIRKQIGNAVPPPLIKAFFEQTLLTNKAEGMV